jgi:hypothetical protein
MNLVLGALFFVLLTTDKHKEQSTKNRRLYVLSRL